MNKLKAIFFKDVDIAQFYATLKKLLLISFLSSFLVLIDGVGLFFIPFILGSFIVYRFHEEKQRIPFAVYFLPFIFLFIFLTGGGAFIIDDKLELNLLKMDDIFGWMLVGIWCAYLILLCIWLLFKIQLKIIHFLLMTILIPIPYLLGLNGIHEHASGFLFYLLWNSALSVVLSLLFSQKPLTKKPMKLLKICILFIAFASSCDAKPKPSAAAKSQMKNIANYDVATKTIHVFVALCDNKYQGIVPVPKAIGNGQDPANNLYWGCAYGVKTYFKKSKEWKLLKTQKLDKIRMERLVFKHINKNYYLVADAYDGQYIKKTTTDFLYSAAGQLKDTIQIDKTTIGINGNAKMVAYIGHDGLMDFQLNEDFKNADGKQRDAIVLACISKKYFAPHLTAAKANPIVWTTGLMAPEAYILHDALSSYVNGGTPEQARSKAALAYTKFQKCSLKASRNLLVTGY